MNTNSIGLAVRKYRHKNNLSQDELSKLSGVSYHTIVKLEKPNVPANPTIETLTLVAKILGVSIQELIQDQFELR